MLREYNGKCFSVTVTVTMRNVGLLLVKSRNHHSFRVSHKPGESEEKSKSKEELVPSKKNNSGNVMMMRMTII